jgi:GcrA cell cycle regulator
MTARGTQSVPWTTEQEDRLRVLVAEGKSFSAMAAELGVTRNACIGKAHRLRLPSGPKVAKPRPPPPVPWRAANPKPPPPAKAAKPRRSGGAVAFMGLTDKTCRWPLFAGDEPFHMKRYCGRVPVTGSPYCKTHISAAFRRGEL